MKKKRIIPILTAATLLCLAATLLLTTACSQENTLDPTLPTGEPVEVQFQIPGFVEMSDGGTTRATSALPEGTTVRVNVYPTTTMSKVKPLAHQAYSMKGGHLVPCTVNADGTFKADDPTGKISLPPGKYLFFTYTPALEFKFNDPHYLIDIPQNTNFATSGTPNTVVAFTGGVNLNPLNRACSRLQLKVKCDDASTAMTAMTVNSVTLSGINADHKEYLFGGSVPQTSSGTASVTTTTFTKDATNPLISTGDIILFATGKSTTIPVQVSFDVTCTALGIEFNETFSGNLDLTLEFGKSYTLNATISKLSGINLTIENWEENDQDNNLGVGLYPFVTTLGNIQTVVSKDLYGSSGAMFHPFWNDSHPDSDYWTWYSALYGFTYTVSKRFMVYKEAFKPNGWANAKDLCYQIGGWRIPTVEEDKLINRLKLNKKLTIANDDFAFHWSSIYYGDRAMAVRALDGFVQESFQTDVSGNLGVRCVKDVYPYLSRNEALTLRVIVYKDKEGAGPNTPLHDNWLVTPIHKQGDAENSCSAMLEVAGSDAPNPEDPTKMTMTWEQAINSGTPACTPPWRLPTIAEGNEIRKYYSVLNMDELKSDIYYWTATRNDAADGIQCFNSREEVFQQAHIENRVRCVRDL